MCRVTWGSRSALSPQLISHRPLCYFQGPSWTDSVNGDVFTYIISRHRNLYIYYDYVKRTQFSSTLMGDYGHSRTMGDRCRVRTTGWGSPGGNGKISVLCSVYPKDVNIPSVRTYRDPQTDLPRKSSWTPDETTG